MKLFSSVLLILVLCTSLIPIYANFQSTEHKKRPSGFDPKLTYKTTPQENISALTVKISKKEAIIISLWQMGAKNCPDCVTIKIIGLVKINGRTAWKIKCTNHDPSHKWCYLYVDTKTGESKKNRKMDKDKRGELSWRSLDNVIASHAATSFTQTPYVKMGWKIRLNNKTIWKVPLYDKSTGKPKFKWYVYVNVKEKLAKREGMNRWATFKEIGIE